MADGIVAPNSYHVFLKNGTEETVERNPAFNQRVQEIRMKFNLPGMESDKEYQFKDIIGRFTDDFSEVEGPLRKKDKQEAQETKARVLATFMCIVVDEHFKRAEYVSDRVYHWNGQGRSEDESTDVSNLKDRELWKIYKWQSKIDGDNPERRDLPQYENLKDYILHMFVESEGNNDFLANQFVPTLKNNFVVSKYENNQPADRGDDSGEAMDTAVETN